MSHNLDVRRRPVQDPFAYPFGMPDAEAAHLRDLRYFLAVADELSFTRAAAALFVAQPALSKRVRALEPGLGVELFARGHRSIALTAAGAALVPHARRIVDEWGAARGRACATAGQHAHRRLPHAHRPRPGAGHHRGDAAAAAGLAAAVPAGAVGRPDGRARRRHRRRGHRLAARARRRLRPPRRRHRGAVGGAAGRASAGRARRGAVRAPARRAVRRAAGVGRPDARVLAARTSSGRRRPGSARRPPPRRRRSRPSPPVRGWRWSRPATRTSTAATTWSSGPSPTCRPASWPSLWRREDTREAVTIVAEASCRCMAAGALP